MIGGTWVHAVTTVGVLTALLLLATLISLTTPTSEIVQALVVLVRPLRRFGIDPDRVGLLLALGIRAVPQVVDLALTIRDAQRARGLTADPRAFAVPLIVRSLRHADQPGPNRRSPAPAARRSAGRPGATTGRSAGRRTPGGPR